MTYDRIPVNGRTVSATAPFCFNVLPPVFPDAEGVCLGVRVDFNTFNDMCCLSTFRIINFSVLHCSPGLHGGS